MDIFYATISGRATEDAKFKTTSSGNPVVTFSVALNLTKDITNYIAVSCFGNLANAVGDFIKKGSSITAVGAMRMTVSDNGKAYLNMAADSLKIISAAKPEEKEISEEFEELV